MVGYNVACVLTLRAKSPGSVAVCLPNVSVMRAKCKQPVKVMSKVQPNVWSDLSWGVSFGGYVLKCFFGVPLRSNEVGTHVTVPKYIYRYLG